MDIIHLLEVLHPANNVLTVKIDDGKSSWEFILTYIVPLLPVLVALFAMWISHLQFHKNFKQQVAQFQSSDKQQQKALKLNARLATEIELKKENCREIKAACTDFLEYAGAHLISSTQYHRYREMNKDHASDDLTKLIDDAFNVSIRESQKLGSLRTLLHILLDPDKDSSFLKQIDLVINLSHTSDRKVDSEFWEAKNKCLSECRSYINSIKVEITHLTESIESEI
jgi:Neuraminidase (sialidase)